MITTEGMWKDLKDICVWPWKMVGLWWLQRLASDGSNRSHGLSEPQQWIWNGQEFQGSCNEDQKRHLDLTTETQGVCVIACVWADWRCSGRPIWSALFLRKTICQKHKGGMETQKAGQPGREFKKPLIIFFFYCSKDSEDKTECSHHCWKGWPDSVSGPREPALVHESLPCCL